jgi:integration host factor subunit alpha
MAQKSGVFSMTLTKVHIVNTVAEQIGYPKNQSTKMIETLLEIIKRTLESGEELLVSGFGKFCVKTKRERRGRNPATGEDMMLEPRRVVTFRCSRQLRDRVNGKHL